MVIFSNYEVSTFILVHHSFLIDVDGVEIDRNQRQSFAGCHFELLKTKVNERHLARFCIAILCHGNGFSNSVSLKHKINKTQVLSGSIHA